MKNPFLATVTHNRELHHGGDRSCMHVELEVAGSRIRYDAGDHVAIYVTNDVPLVEKLARRLDVQLDQLFTMTTVDRMFQKND